MKSFAMAIVILVFGAGLVMAQAGSIGVFADPAGTNCNLLDGGTGVLSVYVVHVLSNCATASQFAITTGGGFTGVKIGETYQFSLVIGNTTDGVSIAYGTQLVAPIHLVTISYVISGTSSPCSWIKVVDDPTAPPPDGPGIYMVDCQGALVRLTGGTAIVNDDGSCTCNVPAEKNTWGQIKSLYRD